MENATKALIIVAGVFLGLMIIALGIHLYTSLGAYVEESTRKMEANALHKFNNQFWEYINYDNNSATVEFDLKIQDIVTVANIAFENNKEYDFLNNQEYNESTLYITVNMTGKTHLERDINTTATELLANNIDNKYKCTVNDVKVSSITGRVYEINFTKIPD